MYKFVTIFWLVLFVLLAWKLPYKNNNLIANLEPFPDTLYYSVAGWNYAKGNGFVMEIDEKNVPMVVPPGYNWLLIPFFWISEDVRSFYWLNLLMGVVSLWLFIGLAKEIFENFWITTLLATLLITNFYFYNLPSLLMAENLMLVFELLVIWVILKKISYRLLICIVFLGTGLVLIKMSALPVLAVLLAGLGIKLVVVKDRKIRSIGWLCWLCLTGLIGSYLWFNLTKWRVGNEDFELGNLTINLYKYFRSLLGGDSNYLWYTNALLTKWLAILGFLGLGMGVWSKKYRSVSVLLVSLIAGTVVFHSFKSYPEGRYVSVVVPLIIFGIGFLIKLFFSRYLWLPVVLLLVVYFGERVTINGFYERRVTTLKRQLLNNFRAENEVSWNYMAVQFFNSYFKNSENGSYLGTLLPAFYVEYFSNHKYKVLPVSETQEFSIPGRDLISQYYKNDGSLLKMYHRLVNSGKNVYVTNYYLQNHRHDWDLDFAKLENEFAFEQVAAGCMDLCKIYKLENKMSNNQKTSSRQVSPEGDRPITNLL